MVTMADSLMTQDWEPFIEVMVAKARKPQDKLNTQKTELTNKISELDTLKRYLTDFRTITDEMKTASQFNGKSLKYDDVEQNFLTASASSTTNNGIYNINILALASRTTRLGSEGIGKKVADTSDVSGVILSDLSIGTSITEGKFTVNEKTIEIARTDSLQDVFDKINTATSGEVTGSYDQNTDKITLTSSGNPINLGVATDTSNFLTAAKLYSNGTTSTSSQFSLGRLDLDSEISATGSFSINGKTIEYSSTDTMNNLMARVNGSDAGVYMMYSQTENRFIFQNKQTGSKDIVAEDVSGNFLSSTGLDNANSTLTLGANARITINNGSEIISHSNNIDDSAHGISGLTINAQKLGEASFTVNSEASKASQMITKFVNKYNEIQKYVSEKTKFDVVNGKHGVFANNSEVKGLMRSLRSIMYKLSASEDSQYKRLADVGVDFSQTNNTISINSKKLTEAFEKDPDQATKIFTDTNSGVGKNFTEFIDNFIDNSIKNSKTSYENQQKSVTRKIDSLEQQITIQEATWRKTFQKLQEMSAKLASQSSTLSQFLK